MRTVEDAARSLTESIVFDWQKEHGAEHVPALRASVMNTLRNALLYEADAIANSRPRIRGPLSAVQVMAIMHPYTTNRNRDAVIRNSESTLGQVGGMTERWANKYLNEHPLGQKLGQEWWRG